MGKEKLIKELKEYLNTIKDCELKTSILNILDNQDLPTKVLDKKYSRYLGYSGVCPKCNAIVTLESSNYCKKCGKELDWYD